MLTGQAVTNVFDGRKVLDGDPSDPHAFALKVLSPLHSLRSVSGLCLSHTL